MGLSNQMRPGLEAALEPFTPFSHAYLMARSARRKARSGSWGSSAVNKYRAQVCMGTLSRKITSPKPLKGPPTETE